MRLLKLLFSFVLFFLFSCVSKEPGILKKDFYVENINSFIKKIQNYNSVEGTLNLFYESKDGVLIDTEAFLRIESNKLILRVYYLGFPAGEIYEEDGQVSSNVFIEKDFLKQIVTGIKKGFLWWQGDFSIEENPEEFTLKETDRVVFIQKEDFVPVKQILTIDSKNILINYERYEKIQTEEGELFIMPVSIKVNYKNFLLKIEIEKMKIQRG